MRAAAVVVALAIAALLWFAFAQGKPDTPTGMPQPPNQAPPATTPNTPAAVRTPPARKAVPSETLGPEAKPRAPFTVRGRTVDARGMPLRDAEVHARGERTPAVVATTGGDGRFELAVDLPDGGDRLRVRAAMTGRSPWQRTLDPIPASRRGETLDLGDLVLLRGAVCRGVIATENGEGVEHALVVAQFASSTPAPATIRATGRSAADGRFTLARGNALAAGRWNIGVYGGGVLAWTPRFVDVTETGPVDLNIVATVGPAISGQLLDPRGRPIQGVLITAAEEGRAMRSSALPQPKTDREGRFLVRPLGHVDVQRPVRLVAATAQWRLAEQLDRRDSASVQTYRWGEADVAVTLTDLPAITVVARRGDDGRLLQRFGVSWSPTPEQFLTRGVDQHADGSVRLPALDPGPGYLRVVPDAPGLLASPPQRVDLARDSEIRVEVHLQHGTPLDVMVVTPDGDPLPGCNVELLDLGEKPLPAPSAKLPSLLRPMFRPGERPWVAAASVTDAHGRAELTLPATGALGVRVHGSFPAITATVTAADRARGQLQVVTHPGGTVVGTVDPASVVGAVFRGVRVALLGDDGSRLPDTRGITIDTSGRFRFEHVRAGRWRAELLVLGTALPHPTAAVHVEDAGESTVTIDASALRPGQLAGEVAGGSRALTSGRVELAVTSGARTGQLVQLSDGRFHVPAILPGDYRVIVTAGGARLKTEPATVQIAAGASIAVTFQVVE